MNTSKLCRLVEFTLDVLRGCKWNCSGCNVDKYAQDGLTDDDFNRLLVLFQDLKSNNRILGDITIGPTDFMTAENSDQVLNMKNKQLFDMFKSVILQTTFLEDEETIITWGKKLAPVLNGNTLKFAIPIEPKHYKNKKYIKNILSKRDLLLKQLPNTTYKKTYLIGNLKEYMDYNADPFNNDKITFEEYSEEFHKLTNGGHMDLVISAGRKTLTDINNRLALKRLMQYHNALYNNSIDSEHSKKIVNFTFGKPHEGHTKDYIYRNGSLYVPVFAGELLVTFETEFMVPTQNWTTATLDEFKNNMLINSLEYLPNTHSCSSCEFASTCISRGIILLMKTLHETNCLAPHKAFTKVRQSS